VVLELGFRETKPILNPRESGTVARVTQKAKILQSIRYAQSISSISRIFGVSENPAVQISLGITIKIHQIPPISPKIKSLIFYYHQYHPYHHTHQITSCSGK
jgi:hypothetical protein